LKQKKPVYDLENHYLSSKGSPFGKATMSGPFALHFMINAAQGMLQNFLDLMGEKSYLSIFGEYCKII
jgi:hypothetical protein